MKLNKKQLQELVRKVVKSYLQEAEGEEADPFAAAEAGGPEAAGAAGEEEKDAEKKDAKPEEPAGIPVSFNISAVKKYNNSNFVSDKGVVKSIDKRGIIVTTQPDGVDVLVNFDDISESVKKFFKK